ncbi:heme uptake transmembrane sensor [Bordetella ansorpii]|uniref:Heme uptake transmembrane sensor n=1 Tax=Bordetella ansorpii TaxID=288768 RepID=A0A157SW45_9BORD|nr:DUF4880 domain-containing protein [Bordetella ansorpii]SAI74667.1 heme uptake transmembrane sensor [Bordetella ansorpii]
MSPAQSSSGMSAGEWDEIESQAQAWAVELGTDRPTRRTLAAFHRWRGQSAAHAQAWEQAAQEWRQMGQATLRFDVERPRQMRSPAQLRNRRRAFLGGAAAAFGTLGAFALIRPPLHLWPSWGELQADYRTGTGEQRDVALGRKVTVSLNTQTSVSLQQPEGVPQLQLISGEAALQTSGTPCELVAGPVRLLVEQGEVELRRMAEGGAGWARCRRGTARLVSAQAAVTLAAGQQVSYDGDKLGPVTTSSGGGEWRRGMVVFHDLPLSDVVAEINRYRPGRVVLMNQELAGRRFSANFSIGRLDDAIEQLRLLHGVHIRRVGDLVLLT